MRGTERYKKVAVKPGRNTETEKANAINQQKPARQQTTKLYKTTKAKRNERTRNRRHNFAQLQLVQNRRFAGGVEADHQNAHFLLAEQADEQLADCQAHFVGFGVLGFWWFSLVK